MAQYQLNPEDVVNALDGQNVEAALVRWAKIQRNLSVHVGLPWTFRDSTKSLRILSLSQMVT